ncbi:lytic transglycosylase domain-containing protein [Sphingomonas koreensis]|uniref:lytic transglycosylase domain-containing protein n=1 Tax=Sphingomonas koreensis TaxID=93064 RepID=UPI00234F41FC|nr:lytic transglycosylase domain-containing protein [Sphingomonas koreensis]MDC7810925.1 lytic transglycosylase domain-containing protein [Sphingomonas koreensis]
MAAVRALAVAVALLAATPTAAGQSARDPVQRWRAEIAEASARFGIPVAWVERVMRAESGGRTVLGGRPITSSAGAMGLMQLMPATWAAMRAAHGLGSDPHAPRDNILAGTAYLRAMYDRFGYPGLFAAYNAGPGRYAAHLASGRTLPAETRDYLAVVAGSDTAPPAVPDRGGQTLFVVLRRDGASPAPASEETATAGTPDLLFAVRAPR